MKITLRNFLLILFFSALSCVFIQDIQTASVSELERSQEIIQQEELMREKIKEDKKIYVKKIIVSGVALIDKETIDKIVSPFAEHWLTEEEIQQILDLIVNTYKQKGYTNKPAKISFRVIKNTLEINVEE